MPELREQAGEIQRICAEAGLTPDEMAARVAIKPESMRKIYNGYQPASEPLMQSFRNVAMIEAMRRQAAAKEFRAAGGTYPEQTEAALLQDRVMSELVLGITYLRAADPDTFSAVAKIVKTSRDAIIHQKGPRLSSKKVSDAARGSKRRASRAAGVAPKPEP